MTGVLPFLFFFTSTQSSQAYTIMDAVTINTIITSMDARTQRDEYGEYEIIEHDGHTVKHYIASGTLHSMPKDVPTYPEPEGDPSY